MLFPLGQIVATRGVLNQVPESDLREALERYKRGDWGIVSREDWELNDDAVREGSRILAAYLSSNGVKFWIITEGDRSVTTFLLPEEY